MNLKFVNKNLICKTECVLNLRFLIFSKKYLVKTDRFSKNVYPNLCYSTKKLDEQKEIDHPLFSKENVFVIFGKIDSI